MSNRRHFLAAASAAALASCNRSDGRKIIGVVPKGASHLFWQTIHAGATMDSIVVQDPFRMGYECMKAMADHLAGREPLSERDSDSYLVTRENVDDPAIQAVVFPAIDEWLNGA